MLLKIPLEKNLKKIRNNFILKSSIQSNGKFNSFKFIDSKNADNQKAQLQNQQIPLTR